MVPITRLCITEELGIANEWSWFIGRLSQQLVFERAYNELNSFKFIRFEVLKSSKSPKPVVYPLISRPHIFSLGSATAG
ncbi:hypothetical protein V565_234800 [Rhizoctonia solani 123E]|uniref:Uncharacterized protein n=1 Tax=Rhizoctonia solani 123E TaxID=1423351 RepID=A0A074S737_9AGAM|nr:hypothetical protein V565_234800 [Rhizoctonia solani 123E]